MKIIISILNAIYPLSQNNQMNKTLLFFVFVDNQGACDPPVASGIK